MVYVISFLSPNVSIILTTLHFCKVSLHSPLCLYFLKFLICNLLYVLARMLYESGQNLITHDKET